MSDQVPDEDWWHALRCTYATVSDKASALDFPEDSRVKAAVRKAIQALTDVATELVVAEAEWQIERHKEAIEEQRNLLKAFGRDYV